MANKTKETTSEENKLKLIYEAHRIKTTMLFLFLLIFDFGDWEKQNE